MDRDTIIITSNFDNVDKLISKDYLCISIVGKVYKEVKGKEQIERIRTLNTYRFYYHLRSKDYFACYYLYNIILEKKGIDKLLEEIKNLLFKYKKNKVALCDDSTEQQFGFRHILRCFLIQNGTNVTDTEKIDLELQKEYWEQDIYKQAGHFNLTDEFVGKTLENCKWIFAKTMLNNPHWYTLRTDFADNEVYLQLVSHIRYFGESKVFQGVLYRIFSYKSYQYWTMPQDLTNETCDLINRKCTESDKISDK